MTPCLGRVRDKVIVIGCPGAGKSTFSRKLRAATGLPLHHLDMIFHRPDKTTISQEQFDQKLQVLLAGERWIVDGNYWRTLPLRLAAAEQVFFFDLPLAICLAGAEKRVGAPRGDLPWVEEEMDPAFRQSIVDFPREQLPKIKSLLAAHASTKTIIVFKSHAEADGFLAGLG